jgi:hypothetical protein
MFSFSLLDNYLPLKNNTLSHFHSIWIERKVGGGIWWTRRESMKVRVGYRFSPPKEKKYGDLDH